MLRTAAYAASAALHLAAIALLAGIGPADLAKGRIIEFSVVEEKPPEPRPEVKPPEPAPKKPPPPRIAPRPVEKPPEPKPVAEAEPAKEEPKAEDTTDKEVFGVDVATVAGGASGGGMRVRVGNTLMKTPEKEFTPAAEVKPYRPAPPPPRPAPVPAFKLTERPVLVNGVKVPYPEEARRQEIEGKVLLQLEIDEQGRVRFVKILSGPGFGLNEAAAEAARSFEFRPGTIGGRPVATWITFTYTFVLED
jgi:protein TonB